jgi:multidrug efflux pump subunit AcrB
VLCEKGRKKSVEKAYRRLKRKYVEEDDYTETVMDTLDSIIKHDINVDGLESVVNSTYKKAKVIENIDGILARGIKPTINPEDIHFTSEAQARKCVETMAAHPELFDLGEVSKKMSEHMQMATIDILRANGIDIDIRTIAKKLSARSKIIYAKQLAENGVRLNASELVDELDIKDAADLLEEHIEELRQQSIELSSIAEIIQQKATNRRETSIKNSIRPTLWRLGLAQ